jgi:cbb3-type cytochrome oxidase subunit 3
MKKAIEWFWIIVLFPLWVGIAWYEWRNARKARSDGW